MTKRRRLSSKFKSQIIIEALKENKTLAELSSEHLVHAQQITNWKKQAINGMEEIFKDKRQRPSNDKEISSLYEQIGRLKMKLEWLKKNVELSIPEKRSIIDPTDSMLSITEQCEALGLPHQTIIINLFR